ncbi:hypothetical protein ACSBOB_26495 [Mesorhizobium sp. ASY16-5R]|uniref:hypothetical protein n=1 Tax=Mesorhizobium sp. ASY16-5R TaxID=3445772 RepID=UPI003FA0CC3E
MTKKAARSDIRPHSPAEYDFWYFDADAARKIPVPAEVPLLALPGGRVGAMHAEGDRRRL